MKFNNFLDILFESNFSSIDFAKHDYKYINAVLDDINNHVPITIDCGKKEYKEIILDPECPYIQKINKAIDTNSLDLPEGKFKDMEGNEYAFTKIFKQRYSQSSDNSNTQGAELANAGELITIKSLTKKIETKEDTENPLFINNQDLFNRWKNTFTQTRKLLENFLSHYHTKISDYIIEHDATNVSMGMPFLTRQFAKLAHRNKNTYNPADIYLIKKSRYNSIISDFNEILETVVEFQLDEKEQKVVLDYINDFQYALFRKGDLFSISLKQLSTKGNGNLAVYNEPKDLKNLSDKDLQNDVDKEKPFIIEYVKYKIDNLFKYTKVKGELGNGVTIGAINFVTVDNKIIAMQNRVFGSGRFGTTQTEIVKNETDKKTGGRDSKIPKETIESLYKTFGGYKKYDAEWYGTKTDPLGKLNDSKIKILYDAYKNCYDYNVINKGNVSSQKKSYNEFKQEIEDKQNNITENSIKLCIHFQGLMFINFFIINKQHLSHIVYKMVQGAKKILNSNPVYIKIY